jgi:hypothetical protein
MACLPGTWVYMIICLAFLTSGLMLPPQFYPCIRNNNKMEACMDSFNPFKQMIKVMSDLEDALSLFLQQLTKQNRVMQEPSLIFTARWVTPFWPSPTFSKSATWYSPLNRENYPHYLDGSPTSYKGPQKKSHALAPLYHRRVLVIPPPL